MRRRRNWFNNPIAFVFTAVSFCCLLIITISILKVPDLTPELNRRSTYTKSPGNSIGAFGEMMIQMLPEDLAFTIFIPSEAAFARELRLKVNESLTAEKSEDTYAVVSRVLGFSAVPWKIESAGVPFGKEMEYDSISGFQLFVEKGMEGKLVVNGVKSETVDLRRGEIVVHLMDGVVMDAEFQESIQPFFRRRGCSATRSNLLVSAMINFTGQDGSRGRTSKAKVRSLCLDSSCSRCRYWFRDLLL